MRIILFLLFSAWCSSQLFAQTATPIFQLGVSSGYYYGDKNSVENTLEFDKSMVMYNIDATLGLQTYNDKKKKKNIIGVFGKVGFIPNSIFEKQLNDLNIVETLDSARNNSDFTELEFGIISQQVFRLSLGFGSIKYYDEQHISKSLSYLCASTGLSIPISSVRLNLLLTTMGGKDFEKLIFRPSIGMVIQFD